MSAYNYNGIKPLSQMKFNISSDHCLYVVSENDMVELAKTKNIDYVDGLRTASGYVAASLDSNILRKLVKDLGFTGRAYEKKVNGKKYVIFKGRPGQRKIFTGTKYLSNNAKVVDMIVGQKGIKTSAIQGARLTIFLTVPLIVLQHVLKDRFLLNELVGDLSVSLIKIGISSIVGAVFATGTTAITTIAAAPVALAIVVGLAVSYALDRLDKEYRITERLAKLLEDKTMKQVKKTAWEVEDRLRWQTANSQAMGKGVYY
ncbi:hypothetical protein C9I94_18390 [Photobacterium swingsii]|uniref:Uncharacterized protein n=1 Tax=Photobacterium swingsii TaxID=680026 RepID=A0A2T3P2N2_9GAMM|nr:hypothetical protein [Photobacterium swingsii]PSW22754.1 hypothetical protein C9I94_18390 [Photobacterium swingsii]